MGPRAAVLGRPVSHSLSPTLHRAAYVELGLATWSYEAIECAEAELPGFVRELGAEWVGLSVTMPGKVAALRTAEVATDRTRLVGAANTLVHRADGTWLADCTDVDGVVGALRDEAGATGGDTAVVLGAGGTARAALAGLADLGVQGATLVVRDAGRAAATVSCAEQLGLITRLIGWETAEVAGSCAAASIAVCTVPAEAAAPVADAVAQAPVVLDAAYHPWPTPIAAAVARRGGRLASGLDMLLHQAFGQVEQFTGKPAPREVMRAALHAAV